MNEVRKNKILELIKMFVYDLLAKGTVPTDQETHEMWSLKLGEGLEAKFIINQGGEAWLQVVDNDGVSPPVVKEEAYIKSEEMQQLVLPVLTQIARSIPLDIKDN